MSDTNVYKMGKGEYLSEGDVEPNLENFFGTVSRTETFEITDKNGETHETTFYVVDDVELVGLDSIAAGRLEYSDKKDRLGVIFQETDVSEIDDFSKAREAIKAKNDFLEAVTGRSPKNRKQSIKNQKKAAEIKAGVSFE